MTVIKFFFPKVAVNELGSQANTRYSQAHFSSSIPAHSPFLPGPASPECSSVHFVHKQLLLWALSWVLGIRQRLRSPTETWGSTAAPIFHPRPLWTVHPPADLILAWLSWAPASLHTMGTLQLPWKTSQAESPGWSEQSVQATDQRAACGDCCHYSCVQADNGAPWNGSD